MKKLILGLLLVSASAFAEQNITLQLSDEMVSGNMKVCMYSDSAHDETLEVKKYQDCPITKTFQTDD